MPGFNVKLLVILVGVTMAGCLAAQSTTDGVAVKKEARHLGMPWEKGWCT